MSSKVFFGYSWVFWGILCYFGVFFLFSRSFLGNIGQLWSTLWWWGRVSSEVSRAGQSTFLPLPLLPFRSSLMYSRILTPTYSYFSYLLLLTHPSPLISCIFSIFLYSYIKWKSKSSPPRKYYSQPIYQSWRRGCALHLPPNPFSLSPLALYLRRCFALQACHIC